MAKQEETCKEMVLWCAEWVAMLEDPDFQRSEVFHETSFSCGLRQDSAFFERQAWKNSVGVMPDTLGFKQVRGTHPQLNEVMPQTITHHCRCCPTYVSTPFPREWLG